MEETNEEAKRAECRRICGPGVDPEMHRYAPEMCPYALDYWHNPKLRPGSQENA